MNNELYFSVFLSRNEKKKGVEGLTSLDKMGTLPFSFFLSIGMFPLIFLYFSPTCFLFFFVFFRHFQSRVVLLLFDGYPNENRH